MRLQTSVLLLLLNTLAPSAINAQVMRELSSADAESVGVGAARSRSVVLRGVAGGVVGLGTAIVGPVLVVDRQIPAFGVVINLTALAFSVRALSIVGTPPQVIPGIPEPTAEQRRAFDRAYAETLQRRRFRSAATGMLVGLASGAALWVWFASLGEDESVSPSQY
jgi:hypothetical protein